MRQFSHRARGRRSAGAAERSRRRAPRLRAFRARRADLPLHGGGHGRRRAGLGLRLFASAASAELFGTHGAGPFWRARDGSRVTGQVKARADAPAPGAIPGLLLATSADASPGALAAVTHIQRVRTAGGVAPAQGCAAAADVGKEVQVPYTATYAYFVRP